MSTYSLRNRLQPALQNLLQRVVRFFHVRSSCTTTHISADIQRITLNALCMTISGGRTKQLDIFCRVTGFTSDLLSFVVVELIRFFHGAIQLNFTMPVLQTSLVVNVHVHVKLLCEVIACVSQWWHFTPFPHSTPTLDNMLICHSCIMFPNISVTSLVVAVWTLVCCFLSGELESSL